MAIVPFRMLKEKWLYSPADPTSSFAGKTVLLTGGTAGLGFEAAVKFLSLGATTLIVGARNPEKAKQAKEAIESRAHRPGAVRIWELDMISFSSVKAFAERVNREVVHLDVALLNAGLVQRTYQKSPAGWETTLQVNLLSTVLLALLLIPKLKACGTDTNPTHLAITSSGSHKTVQSEQVQVKGDLLEHLNAEDMFSRNRQYSTSKLLLE
ncbi:hypothetical protein MMC13_005357 [Lambiella insularis]|nr:hypothetical protein [Lambiella insularis]